MILETMLTENMLWTISSDVYGLIAVAGQQLSLLTRFRAYYYIGVHVHL